MREALKARGRKTFTEGDESLIVTRSTRMPP
jgi:hypothetical protein